MTPRSGVSQAANLTMGRSGENSNFLWDALAKETQLLSLHRHDLSPQLHSCPPQRQIGYDLHNPVGLASLTDLNEWEQQGLDLKHRNAQLQSSSHNGQRDAGAPHTLQTVHVSSDCMYPKTNLATSPANSECTALHTDGTMEAASNSVSSQPILADGLRSCIHNEPYLACHHKHIDYPRQRNGGVAYGSWSTELTHGSLPFGQAVNVTKSTDHRDTLRSTTVGPSNATNTCCALESNLPVYSTRAGTGGSQRRVSSNPDRVVGAAVYSTTSTPLAVVLSPNPPKTNITTTRATDVASSIATCPNLCSKADTTTTSSSSSYTEGMLLDKGLYRDKYVSPPATLPKTTAPIVVIPGVSHTPLGRNRGLRGVTARTTGTKLSPKPSTPDRVLPQVSCSSSNSAISNSSRCHPHHFNQADSRASVPPTSKLHLHTHPLPQPQFLAQRPSPLSLSSAGSFPLSTGCTKTLSTTESSISTLTDSAQTFSHPNTTLLPPELSLTSESFPRNHPPTRNLLLIGFGHGVPLLELFQKLQVHGDIRHVLRPATHPHITIVMYKSLANALRFFHVVLDSEILAQNNLLFVNAGHIAHILVPSAHPEVWPMLVNQGRINVCGMAAAWHDLSTLRAFFAAFGSIISIQDTRSHETSPTFNYVVEFENTDDAATAVRNLGCSGLHGPDIRVSFVCSPSEESHFLSWRLSVSQSLTSSVFAAPVAIAGSTSLSELQYEQNNRSSDIFRTAGDNVHLKACVSDPPSVQRANSQNCSHLTPYPGTSGIDSYQRRTANQLVPAFDSQTISSSPDRTHSTAVNTKTYHPRRESEESMCTASTSDTYIYHQHGGYATTEEDTDNHFNDSENSLENKTTEEKLMQLSRKILQRIPKACISGISVKDIAQGKETRRTVMIRNIPNKFTQEMFISLLNETHQGCYDFLYLRIDFKNKCNVGYAFVNFTSAEAVIRFADRFVGRVWGKFKSEKICGMGFATIQGKNALIEKFRNSSVMLEREEFKPKIFYTDGPNRGTQEPFPGPTTSGFRPKVDVLFSRGGAWKQGKTLC
ncbi:hypothetical protein BASA60_006338 [Batrachochytrium salamandrivorans]|nr:hypothetical protein BASA60_006338 [Batrachochytrium salamandrivorans]